MRYLLCFCAIMGGASAAELPATTSTLVTPATKASAPQATPLFDGKDFLGWEFVATPAPSPLLEITKVLHYTADGVIACAGQPTGYIATTVSYDHDYRLHAEWRFTQPDGTPNSGILVHISSGPKNDTAWPLCQQVQMKHNSVGDLLPMSGATFAEPLTNPPGPATAGRAHAAPDSEKPLGEWNICDIVCRGDTIEVTLNGVVQNKITKAVPRAGRVGFQFEGQPFDLRNVRMTPLN